MADTCSIDVFEERIKSLEMLVFGKAEKDAFYPKDSGLGPECVDNLASIQSKIFASTAGKRKIPKVYEKLKTLQENLDPIYVDELALTDDTMTEIILAEEGFIREQASRLEQLQKLDEVLESEHLKVAATPKYSDKLQDLSRLQIKQQDNASEFNQEVRSMLSTYNSIVTLLSKQFVQWDEILTKMEIDSKPKK